MTEIKTAVNVRELDVMSLDDAALVAGDTDRIAAAIGIPFADWAHNCHSISLRVLRTGLFGRGRIARGTCPGVGSQHSWIVLGDDCYDPDGIVDPTLWSYRDDVDGIHAGYPEDYGHRPHGSGFFLAGPMPYRHGGPVIELTPAAPLPGEAREFLAMLGPLDRRGWGEVAHMAVQGWPAAEIIGAMCDTPGLGVLIPIDIRGMLTDRNPSGYYW
jgi:hypothetical protein